MISQAPIEITTYLLLSPVRPAPNNLINVTVPSGQTNQNAESSASQTPVTMQGAIVADFVTCSEFGIV
jgi:hypothetical protein